MPLRATEFDIDVGTDEARQGQLMHDYLTVMFSHPAMEAITMWGFWQGTHWRPNAALYRTNWTEKPSLLAYQDLVFNEWWTNVMGMSDELGEYLVRAFKGEYDITVEYNGQDYVVPATINDDVGVTITLPFPIVLPGDYNADGTVDAADYVVWRKNVGGSSLPNETVSLGTVDEADYIEWRAHFGRSTPGSASAQAIAAPEPTAAALVMLSLTALLFNRNARPSSTKHA
jgi:hypothetical protein